jgi:uncharacterized membrane protein (DUF4010 family)
VTWLNGTAAHLAVALAIGLLIGAERERRKGRGRHRGAAGIRTFALVALSGGVAAALGVTALLVVAAVFVAVLAAVAYALADRRDPGLTTETALFTAFLLGVLAQRQPGLASALAVTVTILLASRERLHRFVRSVLTQQELHDALLFFAAAVVILPLTPDREVGPLAVFNPRTLWTLVVLVMAIGGAGYIALRSLGPRYGLPVAGLASGFISSAATIGAMGARAQSDSRLFRPAVAGAVLSSVSTIVQLAIVIAATSAPALGPLTIPLSAAGAAAVLYGAIYAFRAARRSEPQEERPGRAFEMKTAVIFAVTVTVVMFGAAAARRWLGGTGLLVAASLAGFADTHSAAISVASLVAAGKVPAAEAAVPILAALTTNTVTKAVLATSTGGRRFAIQVIPGLLLLLAAAWAGQILAR